MTETVSFDLGGVAFSVTAVEAAAFSLPGRTMRGCSAKRGDFAMTKPHSS
jgi:hypothetical protein